MGPDKNDERLQSRYSLGPGDAALLILFVVLFLPAYASLRGLGSYVAYDINSLLWRVVVYSDGSIAFSIDVYAIGVLPYIFLKYLLVIQMYRFYRHLTTRKRVVVLGILSEIQMFVMLSIPQIITIIIENAGWRTVDWIFPIPFTLIVCILLLVFVHPTGSEPMWVDKEEQKTWWETKQQEK